MPAIDNDSLIKEYYESIKDKYPQFTLRDIEQMCKAPFWFINKNMQRGDLPIIRVKYFGKFIVFPGKLKNLLKDNERKFYFKDITEEKYLRNKRIYTDLLNYVTKENEEQEVEIIDE